jgi:hypothetical protein
MPSHDGTGPSVRGPGSGHGQGRCRTGFASHNIFQPSFLGRQGWLPGIVVPIVTAIIRDLLNPSGVLRQIAHASVPSKITNNTQKPRQDAEYTVLDQHSISQTKGTIT